MKRRMKRRRLFIESKEKRRGNCYVTSEAVYPQQTRGGPDGQIGMAAGSLA